MKTGIELIAEERARQIAVEGWTASHDDEHKSAALAIHAAILCCEGTDAEVNDSADHGDWGLLRHPRIKQLYIAGALIAAEIDRLQRAAKGEA